MNEYSPDKWVLVDTGNTIKVFATWFGGGFTSGDSWQLSSGIKEINDVGNYWNMPQYSGSVYNLHFSEEGTSSYTNSILSAFIKGQTKVISIEEAIKLLSEGNR